MAIVDVHEKFSRHTRKEKSLQINLDYGIWKSIGHGSEKQTDLFEHGSRRVCCKQVPGTDRGPPQWRARSAPAAHAGSQGVGRLGAPRGQKGAVCPRPLCKLLVAISDLCSLSLWMRHPNLCLTLHGVLPVCPNFYFLWGPQPCPTVMAPRLGDDLLPCLQIRSRSARG